MKVLGRGFGVLEDGRGTTFLYVVLNTGLQVLIFALNVNRIVANYFTSANDGQQLLLGDYVLHHIVFLLFVACEALLAGLGLWVVVHAAAFLIEISGSIRMFKDSRRRGAKGDVKIMNSLRHLSRRLRRTPVVDIESQGERPARCSLLKWCGIPVLILVIVESALFCVCVLESRLLADMSVHFIDLDLVEILGLRSVLERQHALGAGLSPIYWKFLYLLIGLLVLFQMLVWKAATFLDKRMPVTLKYRLFQLFLVGAMFLLIVAPNGHLLLAARQHHFRSQLPFNLLDRSATGEVIPVKPKLSTIFPPVLGKGYPVVDQQSLRSEGAVPLVTNKRNIVIVVQEALRIDEFEPWWRAPNLHQFAQDHKCIKPQMNIAPGHVSELSWFSIIYGLLPFHYHSFGLGHVRSYPLEILKANGYVTTLLSASTCWPYPNTNLFKNFAEFESVKHNGELIDQVKLFADRRVDDGKPFYLYLMMHKSIEEYSGNSFTQEGYRQMNLNKDRDRMEVLNVLSNYSLLDDALVFFTADHGDMIGEHGEMGHGQKESSWWNEKAVIPLIGHEQEMEQYNLSPALTTLVDIVPTYMSQLALVPPLDPAVFSNGMSQFMPKLQDDTLTRHVFCIARYFPRQNKINAIVDATHKLWFRVVDFNETSKRMMFSGEYFSDINDEASSQCTPQEFRHYSHENITAHGGEDKPQNIQALCPVQRFRGYLDNFSQLFWNFLDADKSVQINNLR